MFHQLTLVAALASVLGVVGLVFAEETPFPQRVYQPTTYRQKKSPKKIRQTKTSPVSSIPQSTVRPAPPLKTSVPLTVQRQPGNATGDRKPDRDGASPAEVRPQTPAGDATSRPADYDHSPGGSPNGISEAPAVAMPVKVINAAERQLYLTPGGKYTAEDIRANGNRTAGQKYEGFKASHDRNPQPGDKICPITDTKANPKCTWIVGGKTYQFCCPPCIDEFVRLAKENPDKVKDPEEYFQK
jgi:hypothetical protein